MVTEPNLHHPATARHGVLVWRWAEPVASLSSAPVGGGISRPTWLANIGVPLDYARVDLAEHATEIAVNAVMTVTEAKTQALHERGVPGTGTASDAVVIVWDDTAPQERFAGPRSHWGAKIAQAAHEAVLAGIDRWS